MSAICDLIDHFSNTSRVDATTGSLFRTIWILAYLEEMLWDRGVWHEREWLFGSGWEIEQWRPLLLALLAVPQVTHYVLDGFIWKRRSNQSFAESFSDC